MTDYEWRQLITDCRQRGYRVLIDQYSNLVYAIVLNKLKSVASQEDIDDCVSNIFVEVFNNAETYSPSNGTLKGYLSTIAKRTAIDAYRRLTYQKNITSSIDEEEIILQSDQKNPEEETEQRLSNQQLWQLIKELGEPDTSIIIRQYFYEQSTREIAKALSMTAAAVQKRSIRARKRLKITLECKEYMRKDGCYEKLRQG